MQLLLVNTFCLGSGAVAQWRGSYSYGLARSRGLILRLSSSLRCMNEYLAIERCGCWCAGTLGAIILQFTLQLITETGQTYKISFIPSN